MKCRTLLLLLIFLSAHGMVVSWSFAYCLLINLLHSIENCAKLFGINERIQNRTTDWMIWFDMDTLDMYQKHRKCDLLLFFLAIFSRGWTFASICQKKTLKKNTRLALPALIQSMRMPRPRKVVKFRDFYLILFILAICGVANWIRRNGLFVNHDCLVDIFISFFIYFICCLF